MTEELYNQLKKKTSSNATAKENCPIQLTSYKKANNKFKQRIEIIN